MVLLQSGGLGSYAVGAGCRLALAVRETGPTGAPKPRLLDRVREAIRTRHYSRRTEKAYVAWIKRYIFFHGKRHPAENGRSRSHPLSHVTRDRVARGFVHAESSAERAAVPLSRRARSTAAVARRRCPCQAAAAAFRRPDARR